MATETVERQSLGSWWQRELAGIDHHQVIERVREEAGWNGRYIFMVVVSAAIAILGLLLSSPAVVIGAMLISPLMGPIIGLGFALATADSAEIRRSAIALAAGSMIAIAFTALIVVVSPLQNVTSELAARTRPNLFDLAVAIFSALAGAYATIRGRAGTVVGVAIATALMPPLATVGFGVATANSAVAGGAGLLFLTNLVAIALTAAVMARLYGFARDLSPHQTLFQSAIVLVAFLALAVPLGLSLRKIAWEATASRDVRNVLADVFGAKARLSQVDIDYNGDPIAVTATVLTPRYRADAPQQAEASLTKLLGTPVTVDIEQFRVGMGEADSAALADAQGVRANADSRARGIAERLALIAGIASEDVVVDRTARRAFAEARPLPGATIATYQALEDRAAADAGDWQLRLLPPPSAALPEITLDDDGNPDPRAIAATAWGAKRRGLAIAVSGPSDAVEEVAAALEAAKVEVTRDPGPGKLTVAWRVATTSP